MTHNETIRNFGKMLRNLNQWIDKAAAHAKAKSFEIDVLAQARLAPDAFPFIKQIQAACDQAKFAAAYLSGKQAPAHPDTEQTIAEIRQRIEKCLAFLDTVKAEELAGSEERRVAPPWLQGKWLTGADYVSHVAVPNFYFHVTMAYAILRHNGADLGKMDYIGQPLPVRD
jgi:uncharacterized protein